MIEPVQRPLALPDLPDPLEPPDPPGRRAPRPPRRGKHPKNRLNELSGDEWLFFTKSVLTTAYPSSFGHRLRRAHGANKPPQLMQSLIEFFTPAGGRVLDPFAGVGGTLIGAAIATPPRECVGIEINPRWVQIYRQVVAQVVAAGGGALPEYPLHEGDCLTL